MGTHNRAVDHLDVPIHLPGMVCTLLYTGEELCPQTLLLPAIEPRADGLPMAIALREITPGAARALDPENAVQDGAVIQGGPPCSLPLWWEQWSQLAPLLVGQFIASYHTPFLPVESSLRTQPSPATSPVTGPATGTGPRRKTAVGGAAR